MPTKKYRCRDPKCGAVHHYLPPARQCQRCKRPGMLREIQPGSVLDAIADAVNGKSQRQLFDTRNYG